MFSYYTWPNIPTTISASSASLDISNCNNSFNNNYYNLASIISKLEISKQLDIPSSSSNSFPVLADYENNNKKTNDNIKSEINKNDNNKNNDEDPDSENKHESLKDKIEKKIKIDNNMLIPAIYMEIKSGKDLITFEKEDLKQVIINYNSISQTLTNITPFFCRTIFLFFL